MESVIFTLVCTGCRKPCPGVFLTTAGHVKCFATALESAAPVRRKFLEEPEELDEEYVQGNAVWSVDMSG